MNEAFWWRKGWTVLQSFLLPMMPFSVAFSRWVFFAFLFKKLQIFFTFFKPGSFHDKVVPDTLIPRSILYLDTSIYFMPWYLDLFYALIPRSILYFDNSIYFIPRYLDLFYTLIRRSILYLDTSIYFIIR